MSVSHHTRSTQAGPPAAEFRVKTVISCPGVRPMGRMELSGETRTGANENHWYDALGIRRQWYANVAGLILAMLMLWGGVWIVTEFVRLQRLEACFEAGRRDCMPLDMNRKQPNGR